MNNQETVKIEGQFESEALRILRGVSGLRVITEPHANDHNMDAILHFAGRQAAVAIEFKQRVNAAIAWQLVQRPRERPKRPLLLIAGETTKESRSILENHGISVIDGLGNVHVELPGLLLHLEGARNRKHHAAMSISALLRGKAGILAEALLLEPERVWQVNELAEVANVAPSLAHRVLTRLENEGIVATEGRGPRRVRRIVNAPGLLDLWAEENNERARRTSAHLLAQTPQQLVHLLSTSLERASIKYALTGSAAATLLAPFVTAVPVVELWAAAAAAPDDLANTAHATLVDDGSNVTFLQTPGDAPLKFRERTSDTWIVSRVRLYADLRRDPKRGLEQAEHLRREVIGF